MPPIPATTRLAFLAAFAFASPLAASEAKQPDAALDLSGDQEALFRSYVTRAKPAPVAEPLTVGAILPFRVELHPLPAAVTVEVPAARTRRFVTGTAGIAIVDPADRKILQILPR
jgi:hypothetical protein